MGYSPMMSHYLKTKAQYPDCILLYRLGDFYEMFFEDAEKASEILDLVLTKRDCGDNQRAPMCGVPYHAVDNYIAKLVEAGQKVAICEQLTEPTGKGMVERGVLRVITPGTVMEGSVLEEKRNNFICAIALKDDVVGCAICDITTGEFVAQQFDGFRAVKELQELLVSYKPSEIIANSDAMPFNGSLECVKAGFVPELTLYNDSAFEYKTAQKCVLTQYDVLTMDGFGIKGKKLAVSACGALLAYVNETQKRKLPHLKSIRVLVEKDYMSIDIKTRRNLELTVSANDNKRKGSLLWLLDKTSTSMGARMLANWIDRPLQSPKAINRRLEGVEELYSDFILRDGMIKLLSSVKDIERLAGKISYNNLTPRDCNILQSSLQNIPEIKKLVASRKCKVLQSLAEQIDDFADLYGYLDKAIVSNAPQLLKEGGYIKEGFNSELDRLVNLATNGKKMISELEEYERNRTGIRTLKLGYNRVFGYYFEISNSFKNLAPDDFIRKQTLTNGERYVSPRLKELEEEILTAEEKREKMEKSLFEEVRNHLLQYIPSLQKASYSIACLDCLCSLAKVAVVNNYVKPTINTKDSRLVITEGRHPVVESFLRGDAFITNDTLLDTDENRTMVITGPNMAGKSTYMRQVALITLMAHMGSFVPARSALVPIVDKIFTRVGASDDLSFNQSTFMVEMVEVANIVNNATKNSLIILDEVGRGTSTFDGLSIAWAIMEYVSQNICAKTLFATHYHELTELEGRVPGVKNYKINVKEYNGSVIFLHTITRGGANKSFGIEVAGLAGVPSEICDRARQIVKMLENSDINFKLDDIEQSQYKKENDRAQREVVSILRDIDINRCTPIEAFDILNDLVKRVKNG